MAPKLAITLRNPRERQPVPIVSDAAIMSHGIADGKLLPLIILDTRTRPDIDDVVVAHQNPGASGDVNASWLKPSWLDRSELRLLLEFVQPISCVVIVAFNLSRYAGFVDQIVQNEGLYIQPGRPGDRLKNTLAAPRMVVEVNCDFAPFGNRSSYVKPQRSFDVMACERAMRETLLHSSYKSGAPSRPNKWQSIVSTTRVNPAPS